MDRKVTSGFAKPLKLKFLDIVCEECKKKYMLKKEWGLGCWYCGAVQDDIPKST